MFTFQMFKLAKSYVCGSCPSCVESHSSFMEYAPMSFLLIDGAGEQLVATLNSDDAVRTLFPISVFRLMLSFPDCILFASPTTEFRFGSSKVVGRALDTAGSCCRKFFQLLGRGRQNAWTFCFFSPPKVK
jgi:hypothetical protein